MIRGSSRWAGAGGASTGRAGLAVRIVDMTAAAGTGGLGATVCSTAFWFRAARKKAA